MEHENVEQQDMSAQLVMPKYALYIWGALLTPLAAGVFLSLNILKTGDGKFQNIIDAITPLVFSLLYFLLLWELRHVMVFQYIGLSLIRELGELLFYVEFSILFQLAYTAFLVEWSWKKYLKRYE